MSLIGSDVQCDVQSYVQSDEEEKILHFDDIKEAPQKIVLTEEQVAAVEMVKREPVSILTGGPGTGKTTTCKEILQWAENAHLKVAMCAPSGKAAKRMTEATGRFASTIHALLKPVYDFPTNSFAFQYDEINPLEADLVICDETSMVSNDLMASLLRAIEAGKTRVLFVGDQDQLPSVGAGAVLRDFLASGTIPHVELTAVQRNAGDIVQACHRIKNGNFYTPSAVLDPDAGQNLRHIEIQDPQKIQDTIKEIIVHRMPKRGYDPVWDVQVISPTNEKTELSCDALNKVLQAELNQNPAVKKTDFRVDDKAIQTKNETVDGTFVVNGDMCRITGITSHNYHAHFFDPDRPDVKIDRADSRILMAYAITCHRFQGSESPVVIIPVHRCFGYFVTRPWIYTAISRAKDICITVGQFAAIRQAIRTEASGRITRLQEALRARSGESKSVKGSGDEEGCHG